MNLVGKQGSQYISETQALKDNLFLSCLISTDQDYHTQILKFLFKCLYILDGMV